MAWTNDNQASWFCDSTDFEGERADVIQTQRHVNNINKIKLLRNPELERSIQRRLLRCQEMLQPCDIVCSAVPNLKRRLRHRRTKQCLMDHRSRSRGYVVSIYTYEAAPALTQKKLVAIPVSMFIVAFVGVRFDFFRQFVYGYDKDQSIEQTMKKLERVR